MIQPNKIWELWAILSLIGAVSIWLESKYFWAKKITGALMALIIAMTLSNLGIIPVESVVYDNVWTYIVPLAIPLLLFRADIKKIWRESGRILGIFLISSVGTTFGATISYFLLKGKIEEINKVAAMMTGSYIGGGVNFVAMSEVFKTSGETVSASIVADNLVTVITLFTLITIPSIEFIRNKFATPYIDRVILEEKKEKKRYNIEKNMSLKDISYSVAISFIIVTISINLAEYFGTLIPESSGFLIFIRGLISNKYLLITTLTTIVATLFSKTFEKIKGAEEIGTFLIYYFFAVIGIPATLGALATKSAYIFIFCLIIVLVNLLVTLLGGKLFKFSLEEMLLAVNANIGGPTTAVAMAVAKGWDSLIIPIMLVGTLSYVIGNYMGIIVGNLFL